MRKLLILLPFLLLGCFSRRENKETVIKNNEVFRYTDAENGVICYSIRNSTGISCVKVK